MKPVETHGQVPWHLMVLTQSVLRPAVTSLEEVRQFFVELWSNPGGRSTIFAGAGISVFGPSHLPTAQDVIGRIIKALTDHPALAAVSGGWCSPTTGDILHYLSLFQRH